MMKHVRTYQRAAEEARAALERYPLVITRGDRASLSLAIGLLEDLAAELPAIKRREKARRQRIQWIMVSDRVHVARIGRDVWRVTFVFRTGRAMTVSGRIDGFTLEETLKLCLAALAGKLSGASGTTITIRSAADDANRIVATVDSYGNRSAVTLNAAG
jgi:hypothetical protein